MFYTPEQKKNYYTKRMNDQSLTDGQRNYAKEFVESFDEREGETPGERKRRKREELKEKWNDENNRTVKGVIEQIKGLSYRSSVRTVRVRNQDGKVLYWGSEKYIPAEIAKMRMDTAIPSRDPNERNTYLIWTKEGGDK